MIEWKPLFALVALTLCAGCAGIESLNEAGRPTDLYSLTPKSTFDPGLPRIDQQIVVEEPTATAAVNTNRMAVFPSPLEVEYLPRARWVDRAPLIVQALLVESFENSDKVAAVGRSTVGLRADYIIVSDLREFQASVISGDTADGPLLVEVRINIKIVDDWEDQIIASRSFEEQVVAQGDSALEIAQAFDTARGRALRESVEYSLRRIFSHARANPRPDTAKR